jgi:putative Holliday junction resolvase
LGVDYGTVRIGLALADLESKIASPLATLARRTPAQDAAFFRELVNREHVRMIVVGLPVHMSGQEGEKALEARQFGSWLGTSTGLPILYWDERYTTSEAEQHLQQAKLTAKQRRARRDQIAAQILLQTFIEAGCPRIPSFESLDPAVNLPSSSDSD